MASFASSATTSGACKHAWTKMNKLNYWSRHACVRHTWWRTKRSWPLFSPTFFFFFFLLLRLLLFTHFGETPVRENLFPPIFWHNQKIYAKKIFQVILIFLQKKADFREFFRNGQRSVTEPGPTPSPWSIAFCFSPTSGNLPCMKICFPQYFGITRRYMQKKYFFLVIFIFLRKKLIFARAFRTDSVRSRSLDQSLVPGVFSLDFKLL